MLEWAQSAAQSVASWMLALHKRVSTVPHTHTHTSDVLLHEHNVLLRPDPSCVPPSGCHDCDASCKWTYLSDWEREEYEIVLKWLCRCIPEWARPNQTIRYVTVYHSLKIDYVWPAGQWCHQSHASLHMPSQIITACPLLIRLPQSKPPPRGPASGGAFKQTESNWQCKEAVFKEWVNMRVIWVSQCFHYVSILFPLAIHCHTILSAQNGGSRHQWLRPWHQWHQWHRWHRSIWSLPESRCGHHEGLVQRSLWPRNRDSTASLRNLRGNKWGPENFWMIACINMIYYVL